MVTFGFPRRMFFGLGIAGILCAGTSLVLVGCSRGPKGVKVTGKVYYRDEPYPNTTICFFADSPEGQTAESKTGPDGSFSLRTYKGGGGVIDGVIPGRYKIGIRRQVKGSDSALLPYMSPNTTPLKVEVPPEGLTDYEVRLK